MADLLVDLDHAAGNEAILSVSWPILDLRTPLADLLGAAQIELVGWLRAADWRQAGPVDWSLGREFRGVRPGMTLVASVAVVRAARAAS